MLFEKYSVDLMGERRIGEKKSHRLNVSFRVTNVLFDLEQTDAWRAYSDNNKL